MTTLNDIAPLLDLTAANGAAVAIGHGATLGVSQDGRNALLDRVSAQDAPRVIGAGWQPCKAVQRYSARLNLARAPRLSVRA